jgi:hypothetical protein
MLLDEGITFKNGKVDLTKHLSFLYS